MVRLRRPEDQEQEEQLRIRRLATTEQTAAKLRVHNRLDSIRYKGEAPSFATKGRRRSKKNRRPHDRRARATGHHHDNKHVASGGTESIATRNHYRSNWNSEEELIPYPGAADTFRAFGDHNVDGVSVSSIRSLYGRRRRDQEEGEDRRTSDVRRSLRLGRSGMMLSPPATEGGAVGGVDRATCDGQGLGNNWAGDFAGVDDASCTVSCDAVDRFNEESGCAEEDDGATFPGKGGATTATTIPGEPLRRGLEPDQTTMLGGDDNYEQIQQQCAVFDALDWRQTLSDHSYAAGLVQDLKRALRAGRSVLLRAREEQQALGCTDRADCELMLRTLYMQCVRVSNQKTAGTKCHLFFDHTQMLGPRFGGR